MSIEHHEDPSGKRISIEIAGIDLNFHQFELDTSTPTGGKIAKVAGFNADQHPYVMQWRDDGDLEELRAQEEADLRHGKKFIVAESDGTNLITIEGETRNWPADEISGAAVRKLGRISTERTIYLEGADEPDRLVEDDDIIKIRKDGVEQFRSRKPQDWELNVQGKKIVSFTPVISVVDALTRAGFDPNAWIIILKVQGQPKRPLSVGDDIDLRAPGIEKVRLTAKYVSNGEARAAPARDFSLLEIDASYMDGLGLHWETRSSDGHRWLIINDYPVPAGYTVPCTTLALMIPPAYPQSEIDMFYAYPPLHRAAGGGIPATEAVQSIGGLPFQRWSRHRGSVVPWNPQRDNVVTHLALVESALVKEVGE
ncbi:hypothetical protein GOD96_29405 [Sinorhizobium medicae]|nr:hypothetical protein [Sinorhizobium medicae]